jgi:hypothetical protein
MSQKIGASAHAIGAEIVVNVMTPREWDGQEPPKAVTAAMNEADVVVFPTIKDIAHTRAMREALGSGARGVSMAGYEPDILSSDSMEADFLAQRPACARAAGLVAPALGSIDVAAPLVALAAFSGSLFGGHVNDSGFWVTTKLLGLSTVGGFKVYTIPQAIAAVVSLPLVLVISVVV